MANSFFSEDLKKCRLLKELFADLPTPSNREICFLTMVISSIYAIDGDRQIGLIIRYLRKRSSGITLEPSISDLHYSNRMITITRILLLRNN